MKYNGLTVNPLILGSTPYHQGASYGIRDASGVDPAHFTRLAGSFPAMQPVAVNYVNSYRTELALMIPPGRSVIISADSPFAANAFSNSGIGPSEGPTFSTSTWLDRKVKVVPAHLVAGHPTPSILWKATQSNALNVSNFICSHTASTSMALLVLVFDSSTQFAVFSDCGSSIPLACKQMPVVGGPVNLVPIPTTRAAFNTIACLNQGTPRSISLSDLAIGPTNNRTYTFDVDGNITHMDISSIASIPADYLTQPVDSIAFACIAQIDSANLITNLSLPTAQYEIVGLDYVNPEDIIVDALAMS